MSVKLIGADAARIFLQNVPPSLRTHLRKEFRTAATPLTAKIKTNAAAIPSKRIPGAVKIKTSFGSRSAGVYVYVDSKRAPHALLLEVGNRRNGMIRHPVFGNREVWVNQPTRPFFYSAVRAHKPVVVAAAQKAITDTLRRN